jgi:hypothetical protein
MTDTSGVPHDLFEIELPAQPYPGLRPFEKSEWPIFFGRETITGEVIERLIGKQFLALHGDSGCGKSSLIHCPDFPCWAKEKKGETTGKVDCPEVMPVRRWFIRTEAGSSVPWNSLSLGL